MEFLVSLPAATEVRRVFAAWSIAVPRSFSETFVDKDQYWHAWDEDRSISLTSVVVTEGGAPVPPQDLLRQLGPVVIGTPIPELPDGIAGRASVGPATQPARASTSLTGLLAVPGRILLVTITSDDVSWARETWVSIRGHQAPVAPQRRNREARPRGRGRRRR